jgi:hypothetical protein
MPTRIPRTGWGWPELPPVGARSSPSTRRQRRLPRARRARRRRRSGPPRPASREATVPGNWGRSPRLGW